MRSRVSWKASREPFPVLIVGPESVASAFRLKPPAVEVRADLFPPQDPRRLMELMDRLRAFASVLLTVRRKVDGGTWAPSRESQRRMQLLVLAPHADAVDLELDLVEDEAGRAFIRQLRGALKRGAAVIFSQHDCRKLPSSSQLDSYLEVARYARATRLKIAAVTRTADEAKNLSAWAIAHATVAVPITAIAMGPQGSWTRWYLPKKLGGPAYAPAAKSLAPGQVPYAELKRLLK